MGLQYEIKYRKGSHNGATDALSRAVHGELLQLTVSSVSTELWDKIKAQWHSDIDLQALIKDLEADPQSQPKYSWQGGLLLRKQRLVIGLTQVELQKLIIQWLHSGPQGGHSRVKATCQRIKLLLYWKNMSQGVKGFI